MRGLARATSHLVAAAGLTFAAVAGTQAAGALAVGTCGAYGFAYDYSQADQARTAALKKCKGTCKVVAPMKRDCAALAIDGRNVCGAFGYAAAARLGAAQNTALKQCYQFGGKDCVIRAWVCDGKG
jgi:hypothetical protein